MKGHFSAFWTSLFLGFACFRGFLVHKKALVECSRRGSPQEIGGLLYVLFLDNLQQVLSVLILEHGLCELAHLVVVYPSFPVGDAFEAGYL